MTTINVYKHYSSLKKEKKLNFFERKYTIISYSGGFKIESVNKIISFSVFFELLLAFVLSVVNIIILFKSPQIFLSLLLFSSLCLYISMFILNLKILLKKAFNIDIL